MNHESRIMNREKRSEKKKSSLNSCFMIRDSAESLRRGFTLVEMLVAISLFSFVMLATTTVLLSVVDANHKSQGLKTTIDNLSLTLESVARSLRTGSNYESSQTDSFTNPVCWNGGVTGISFYDQYNALIYFRLFEGAITISKDGGNTETAITAPEITIDRFCLNINGTDPNDGIQPNILISVGGVVNKATVVGAKLRTTSRFDLQTFVTQRVPDVN